MSDTHKGWLIDQNFIGEWEATGPNYDASYEGPEDGGWVDNGERVSAKTREGLIAEIDIFEEERDQ